MRLEPTGGEDFVYHDLLCAGFCLVFYGIPHSDDCRSMVF